MFSACPHKGFFLENQPSHAQESNLAASLLRNILILISKSYPNVSQKNLFYKYL